MHLIVRKAGPVAIRSMEWVAVCRIRGMEVMLVEMEMVLAREALARLLPPVEVIKLAAAVWQV